MESQDVQSEDLHDEGVSFAEMFEQSLQTREEVREGEVVQGTILEISSKRTLGRQRKKGKDPI